jgi:hypothetical protein
VLNTEKEFSHLQRQGPSWSHRRERIQEQSRERQAWHRGIFHEATSCQSTRRRSNGINLHLYLVGLFAPTSINHIESNQVKMKVYTVLTADLDLLLEDGKDRNQTNGTSTNEIQLVSSWLQTVQLISNRQLQYSLRQTIGRLTLYKFFNRVRPPELEETSLHDRENDDDFTPTETA